MVGPRREDIRIEALQTSDPASQFPKIADPKVAVTDPKPHEQAGLLQAPPLRVIDGGPLIAIVEIERLAQLPAGVDSQAAEDEDQDAEPAAEGDQQRGTHQAEAGGLREERRDLL